MGTISVSLPSDGQTIDAADYNTPINTIVSEINGGLDNDNIAADAAIDRTKISGITDGWEDFDDTPDTITANGNRSYDLVFNSVDHTDVVSPGMRVKLTRTVAAPTQCTDLEAGSSQYYSKSSPNGMTFTDDFAVSVWIKLESYADMGIVSRYNGTSGWFLRLNAAGTVTFRGTNAAAGNRRDVNSYQSIPLNKWVHIAAQLDMSAHTATPTTSYVMIDGVDVPAFVDQGGTNPAALIQAGNLEIGSYSAAGFFDGKIAQVAIYSAKVTQATMKASMNQTLSGAETSLVSAYSFNNSITDLNTGNANNLTAQGSAVATNADSPFGIQADGTTAGTTEYAIITKAVFSTNTTLTVQVPEGNAIPTSGGVSAVSYSTQKAPFGFPASRGKWRVASLLRAASSVTSNATYGAFQSGGWALSVPIGDWMVGWQGETYSLVLTVIHFSVSPTALTGLTNSQGAAIAPLTARTVSATNAAATINNIALEVGQSLSAATSYVMYTLGSATSAGVDGTVALAEIYAEIALL